MRRIALLGLLLTLGGCGYKTWWNPPFSGGYNPNLPATDSENMQRVLGQEPATRPMTTEPGDIWPGPLPPSPTLKDLEATGSLTPQPESPVPGSPLSRGVTAPYPSPNPSTGSSAPSGYTQPGLSAPQLAPPLTSYAAPPAAPPGRSSGQVVNTPSGPAVTTGGGPGYQTTTQPGGGQSIIVPNGNGTSTVIHPDGRIETIPTAK
jgi:hypothetical protein